MSRRRKTRQSVRWARYFNHYGHIPGVLVGGKAAWRVVWTSRYRSREFVHVRRQAKHRFGATS